MALRVFASLGSVVRGLAISVGLVAAPFTGAAQAASFYGPSAYMTAADAPFHAGDFNQYFYLEDVEDNAVSTPGLTVNGSGFCIVGANCFVGSGLYDSVGNGGNGQLGRSIFTNGSVEILFDAGALGGLPTFAGLVWTDGRNTITFTAFDQNNVSLGQLVGNHADNSSTGGTAEDRFYGVQNAGGISRLTMSNPAGLEIDHIQYGRNVTGVVPEPATWAMMIIGFGAAGSMIRRRKAVVA
jgi:hypothetical protein